MSHVGMVVEQARAAALDAAAEAVAALEARLAALEARLESMGADAPGPKTARARSSKPAAEE